jgi:hypothetical protein
LFDVVGKARILFLVVSIFVISGINAAYGQTGTVWVWYGTPGDTAINASINDTLYIDVYVKTSDDAYVENIHLVMGYNDQYIDTSITVSEGSFYWPVTVWSDSGVAFFNPPQGSPPNEPGWFSQTFTGWARISSQTIPLLHAGIPLKVLTMAVITANDSNLSGQIVNALGPGSDDLQGPSNAGDESGAIAYDVIESFSPIHFIQDVGRVSGTVINNDADPIEGAIVTVSGIGDTDTTDSNGHYNLELPVGIYSLTFSHPGYVDTTIADIEINLNETTDLDVIMNPLPGGYISGTVVDTAGVPIEGVIVSDLTGINSETTDGQGYYNLSLPEGTYSISFSHDNYRDTTVAGIVVTVDNTVELDMIMMPGIDNPNNTPNIIDVHQNYPNPFNQGTTIEFELQRSAVVTVEIFDILGRKVATVGSFSGQAGLNHIRWNSSGNASGIYFCRVRSSNSDDTRAMLLIK